MSRVIRLTYRTATSTQSYAVPEAWLESYQRQHPQATVVQTLKDYLQELEQAKEEQAKEELTHAV